MLMISATCLLAISCLIWIANLITIVLAHWIPDVSGLVVAMMHVIAIEFFMMIHLCNKNKMEHSVFHKETPTIFKMLVIISLVCTGLSGIIYLALFWEGGPGIENGVYCIWNHGFIRQISEAEYLRLRYAKNCLLPCYTAAFSAAPMAVFFAIRQKKQLQTEI